MLHARSWSTLVAVQKLMFAAWQRPRGALVLGLCVSLSSAACSDSAASGIRRARDNGTSESPEKDASQAEADKNKPDAATSDTKTADDKDDDKAKDDTKKPPADDTKVNVPNGFKQRVLDNGLQVYAARDVTTSNVTVQVWYKVGSKDDPANRSGFAHLFEHLMFKATRNLPVETFDRLTADVGGSNNAFTSNDTTAYYEIIPANHLERLLFAESERMGSLVVDDDAFKAERDVVKEELRQRVLGDPYGRLSSFYVPREAFQEHPYRRAVVGSLEDLDAAKIDEVLAFHATFYRPDNAYLIVVGNFEEKDLNRWVDKYFGPIKRPDRELPVHNVKEPARKAPRESTYYVPNVSLPAVLVNWLIPKYASEDTAALSVLDNILSVGKSSRLYRSMVYEKQLSAEASTWIDQAQQAGNFSVYSIMANGRNVAEGKTALLEEIAKLRDEKVTDEELEEAKNEQIATTLRGREALLGRGNEIGNSLILAGDATAAEKLLERIRKVSADDVQRVAKTYLTDQTYVVINYLGDTGKPADAPAEARAAATDAPIKLDKLEKNGKPVTLAAEKDRVGLPKAGPERDLTTPAVSEKKLANGLRVMVVPRHNVPLVGALLSFDVGSSADPFLLTGTASLTAAMIDQGTSMKTAPQIATQIERLGAQLSATVNADFTQLSVNCPSEVFEGAAGLLSELVHDATFPEAELERVKAQTLDNLAISLSDPDVIVGMASGRVVYGDAPYGNVLTGTPGSVKIITQNDVVTLYRSRWRPSTASLVFTGDIEPDAAYALAEKLFGDLRDARGAAPQVANPAGEPLDPRTVVIDLPGSGQAAVQAVSRSIPRNDPDFYPLALGNAVLGGGYTARLNSEIRIKRGLSYGASSNLGTRVGPGLFSATASTRNDAAAEVVQLMAAEIGRISSEVVSDEELAPRRATLLGSFSRNLETVRGLGNIVGSYAQYGLPADELSQYAPKLRAVTPDQIRDVAQRRLPADKVSYVVVGDAAMFIDELSKTHPNIERIQASDLDLESATLK
jgi:zinc protease